MESRHCDTSWLGGPGRIFSGSWATNGEAVHLGCYNIFKCLSKACAEYEVKTGTTSQIKLFFTFVEKHNPVLVTDKDMKLVGKANKNLFEDVLNMIKRNRIVRPLAFLRRRRRRDETSDSQICPSTR